MITVEQIAAKYPLHWFVWNNDFRELQQALEKGEVSFGEHYRGPPVDSGEKEGQMGLVGSINLIRPGWKYNSITAR